MAAMGIGHFTLLLQDRSGRTIRELEAVSRSGRPLVGDRFQFLGSTFSVHEVLFLEDEDPQKTVRTYFSPQITLRPVGSRPPGRPEGDDPGDRPARIFPSTHDGSRNVLPFEPPGGPPGGPVGSLTAAILPLPLVANLVAIGYRAQASDFDHDKRLAALLLRSPEGQDLRETLPASFDLLSRTAKQRLVDVMVFVGDVFGNEVADGAAQSDQTEAVASEGEEVIAERAGSHLWLLRAA